MNDDLDTRVLGLLNRRRGDWRAVAADARVSYSWLSKFANGRIDNPGFLTLKRLHRVLLDAGLHRPPEAPDARCDLEQGGATRGGCDAA